MTSQQALAELNAIIARWIAEAKAKKGVQWQQV